MLLTTVPMISTGTADRETYFFEFKPTFRKALDSFVTVSFLSCSKPEICFHL